MIPDIEQMTPKEDRYQSWLKYVDELAGHFGFTREDLKKAIFLYQGVYSKDCGFKYDLQSLYCWAESGTFIQNFLYAKDPNQLDEKLK